MFYLRYEHIGPSYRLMFSQFLPGDQACGIRYNKIGCFVDQRQPFPLLLLSHRGNINWKHWNAFLDEYVYSRSLDISTICQTFIPCLDFYYCFLLVISCFLKGLCVSVLTWLQALATRILAFSSGESAGQGRTRMLHTILTVYQILVLGVILSPVINPFSTVLEKRVQTMFMELQLVSP